jgi:hypothetical protein
MVAGLAIGCGNISFKRGASPEAIDTDERACRASTDNDERYVECMKQRGYLVGDF